MKALSAVEAEQSPTSCWWHWWLSRRGRRTGKFSWASWQSLHNLRHEDQCRDDQADDKQHQWHQHRDQSERTVLVMTEMNRFVVVTSLWHAQLNPVQCLCSPPYTAFVIKWRESSSQFDGQHTQTNTIPCRCSLPCSVQVKKWTESLSPNGPHPILLLTAVYSCLAIILNRFVVVTFCSHGQMSLSQILQHHPISAVLLTK